ncbi:MAG: hypothetical protein ACE5IM_07550, partial [Nitrospinota bacterium]
MALARKRLVAAEQRRVAIEGRMAKTEAELRRRIRSLYKGMGAPPSLLAWLSSGVADAARMRVYARRVARYDARLIRSLQEERRERERVMEEIRSETETLAVEKREVVEKESRLRAARKKRSDLLASIRARRDRQRQAYRELRRAADRLQKLIDQWLAKENGRTFRSFLD